MKISTAQWRCGAGIILGTILSLVWYKNFAIYQLTSGENLIFIKLFREPDLYPNLFLAKQMNPIAFHTFFSIPEAWIGLFFDPYWVLYGYFIFINCLCICGLIHLAHTITRSTAASLIAACALTFQWQWGHALGSSAPLGLGPFPDQLATGILLFAVSLFLESRFKAAFFLAGLTFNFHGSFSIYVMFMFGLSLILERKWEYLLRGTMIAGLAALPLVIYVLLHPLPIDTSLSFETWYQLIRLRVAGHTMPSLWGFGTYARFLPYLLLFSYGYRAAIRETGDLQSSGRLHRMLFLTYGTILLCILGTVFAELVPLESIIKLTLFRSTRFFVIFSLIVYTGAAVRSWSDFNVLSLTHVLLLGAAICAAFPMTYAGLALLSLVLLREKKALLLPFVMMAAVGILSAYALWRYGSDAVWADFNPSLYLALTLLLLICALTNRFLKHSLLLGSGLLAAGLVSLAWLSPTFRDYTDGDRFEAIRSVQLWVRSNTPRSSTVIFPPEGSWSAISERAGAFSYLDLNQIYCDFLVREVLSRAEDYVTSVFDYEDGSALQAALLDAYSHWDEEKMKTVAAKYRSHYAVVDATKDYDFPKVYENDFFRIYRIP